MAETLGDTEVASGTFILTPLLASPEVVLSTDIENCTTSDTEK